MKRTCDPDADSALDVTMAEWRRMTGHADDSGEPNGVGAERAVDFEVLRFRSVGPEDAADDVGAHGGAVTEKDDLEQPFGCRAGALQPYVGREDGHVRENRRFDEAFRGHRSVRAEAGESPSVGVPAARPPLGRNLNRRPVRNCGEAYRTKGYDDAFHWMSLKRHPARSLPWKDRRGRG